MAPVLPLWPVSNLYVALGAKFENFIVFDRKGVLHKERTDLDELKSKFANAKGEISLEQAMKDADVFIGLSCGQCSNAGYGKSHGKKSNRICHGQS